MSKETSSEKDSVVNWFDQVSKKLDPTVVFWGSVISVMIMVAFIPLGGTLVKRTYNTAEKAAMSHLEYFDEYGKKHLFICDTPSSWTRAELIKRAQAHLIHEGGQVAQVAVCYHTGKRNEAARELIGLNSAETIVARTWTTTY